MRKRLFDILFSLAILLMGSPLYVILACAVKLSSKGPIFFLDERVGKNGELFRCYKFRTMFIDAPDKLHALLETNPSLKQEWLYFQKLSHDPRVTGIGSFLRKSSLDELPQFFNVLAGSMSVVGPRPVTRKEIEERFDLKAPKILSVKPGITGLWQTTGRSNLSYSERIALEELYVDTRDFWLDIKIIMKTVPAVLASKGAR